MIRNSIVVFSFEILMPLRGACLWKMRGAPFKVPVEGVGLTGKAKKFNDSIIRTGKKPSAPANIDVSVQPITTNDGRAQAV
jgi:hypothetical protein